VESKSLRRRFIRSPPALVDARAGVSRVAPHGSGPFVLSGREVRAGDCRAMHGQWRAMTREQATAAIAEGIRGCTRCCPVLEDLAVGCSSTFTPRISSDRPLVGTRYSLLLLQGTSRQAFAVRWSVGHWTLRGHSYVGGKGGHGGRRPS